MNSPIALLVIGIFVVMALWYFRMAWVHGSGISAAVLSVDGQPLFMPSRLATVAVGIRLLAFATLMTATSEVVTVVLPQALLRGLSFALATGLFTRNR
ncbi:MAG TPA: hypothetical protein VG962_16020 [Steroidobacteraceae bacterium]|nr:hypothetical protein [Steroidobacteraceae bacterium]